MTRYDPNATPWNDGTPWSEMDIIDLMNGLEQGESVEEIAMFIQRIVQDVRAKMAELGLTERSHAG